MALEQLKQQATMTLLRRVGGPDDPAYIVRGPTSQEKAFPSRRDAEKYFGYYVQRCLVETRAVGLTFGGESLFPSDAR